MKRLLLLGCTGSIGTQTLDLLKDSKEYELVGVSAGHNVPLLEKILGDFPSIKEAAVLDFEGSSLIGKFPNVKFHVGEEASYEIARELDYDSAVNALVGFAGVRPTLAVLERGKTLQLANKESLVVAGGLVASLKKKYGSREYPIDSEHVAIAKCLSSLRKGEKVEKILLTASGGPFRTYKREELGGITPEMALNHPTWKMGKKITIDSATMMNKGFELIEACHIFGVKPEDIEVLVHPQSLVHSGLKTNMGYIVEYGRPDMHGPIAYALSEGKVLDGVVRVNDLSELTDCTFAPIDRKRFPLVDLASRVFEMKGNAGAIINGANEEAVYAFLDRKLSFDKIEQYIGEALSILYKEGEGDYAFYLEADKSARDYVRNKL